MKIRSVVLVAFALVAGCSSLPEVVPPSAITVPGDRLFTESLTSSGDGSVFVASIGSRTIYRAAPGSGVAQAWVPPASDAAPGYLGVFADDKSNTLWACVRPAGAAGQPPTAPSTLRAHDLKSGAIKGNYPLPTAGGTCNDIAVGADGAIYATDTANMEVLRLKKGASALDVWAGNGAFGAKGGVLDGISVLGNRVFVNTLQTSKLFAVPVNADGGAGAVSEIALSRAIDRPDGMRSFGKDGLLVVEGGGPGRLSLVKVAGNNGAVTTLKEGYPGGPVAVTVVGTNAYVIEAQFAAMRAGATAPTQPFTAVAVPVGKPDA